MPSILAGDMNVDVEASDEIAKLITIGGHSDAQSWWESVSGTSRQCTHKAGNVIDHALVNKGLLPWLKQVSIDPEWSFPSHRGLCLTMDPVAVPCDLQFIKIPRPLTTPGQKCQYSPEDVNDWTEELDTFQDALAQGDVDKAELSWTRRWETFLIDRLRRAGHDIRTSSIGRAQECLVDHDPNPPRAPWWQDDSLELRQLKRSAAIANGLQRELDLMKGWDFQLAVQKRVERWLSRIRRIHGIRGSFYDAKVILEGLVARQTEKEKKLRREQWRSQLFDHGRACKFLKQDIFSKLQVVQRLDGSFVSDPCSLDEVLQAFWTDVSAVKGETETELSHRLNEFVAHCFPHKDDPSSPFPEITAAMVREAVVHTKVKSAPGWGGWWCSDLRMLPNCAWHELAQLYGLMELQGRAPTRWCTSLTTYIPKQGKQAVNHQRPISVMAMLWRIYAKIKQNLRST